MFEYNTVEEAVKDLQDGKLILVSDDESRENEGDLICAAEFATTENVNFMATYGKGLICMPMSGDLCRKLGLTQMVADNTDNHETAFTVSIDHVKTTTGISAEERGFTARECVSDEAKPEDFRRPGHMFPLRSKPNGVLERNGHTEATVDLMRIAGLKECGLCCEIMKADGTMMRKEDLIEMSEKFNVTLEMGRYIAATCGVLISRIADMKMNDTTRYAIIDSGINHINYYGQAMAMKKPRCEFIPMEYTEGFADGADHEVEVYSQGVQPYNICGSLCTVGDVIVKNLELKDAKIGDMLAFYNIGAYSVTEGIYLFLSRRMPAIVMYSKKNGYRIIRNPVDTFLINSVSTQ